VEEYVAMWKAIDTSLTFVREKYILPNDDVSVLLDEVSTTYKSTSRLYSRTRI